MNKSFVAAAILAIFAVFSASSRGADASYKHWRGSLKAAEQARLKRDFDTMRQILEASAPEAQQLGSLSSAQNAFWLAIAYMQLHMDREALETYNKELERIGPKPTATKLQIIRGVFLTQRGLLYFRVHEYDKALASATDGKAVLEDAAGKYHPELYEAHRIIGSIHAMRRDYQRAEESMRMALKLAESRQTSTQLEWSGAEQETVVYVSEPQPARVTLAASELGRVLAVEGKFEEAEGAFKKALKSAEAAYPKESVMREIPLRGLAEVEFRLNHTKDFEKYTQQLYDIISKNPGYELSAVAPLWLKFKSEVEEQPARAVETLKMILKVFETQNFEISEFGRGAMSVSVTGDQVDWKRADAAQDALIKLADGIAPANAAKAGLIQAEIANFALAHNKPELADAMYARIVKSQQNAPDKGILIAALGKLAERKIEAGQKGEALEFYHSVTKAMREKYGNDMRVADAMDTEAGLLAELGKEQEAKNLKTEAMEVRKKTVGK